MLSRKPITPVTEESYTTVEENTADMKVEVIQIMLPVEVEVFLNNATTAPNVQNRGMNYNGRNNCGNNGRQRGKSGRQRNPLGPDGNPFTYHICNSIFHFARSKVKAVRVL